MVKHHFFTVAALVSLAAGAYAAEPPFPVQPVRYQVLPKDQSFDAVLEAVNQSTVAAQVTGRVVDINFDVSDRVVKGSVLLRIDQTASRAQVDAVQAELQEARARSGEAQTEFDRVKEVYDRKLVARADLDRAAANLKAARARLDAAEAHGKQAQEHLGYTEVRAPYSGIVTKRYVELGETVTLGQPLMTGFSLEKMRAAANVPQAVLDEVRKQGRARVVLTGLDNREISTTGLTVFPFADPDTHTFTVRAELPENEAGVYPGMFAKVLFQVGEERRLLAPAQAIVYRSEVTGVYVVDGEGRVSLRQVRVGRVRDDGLVEVLAGLVEGERVALDPIRAGVYLKEQSGVRS